MHPQHQDTHRIGTPWNGDEMNVIAHQAMGRDAHIGVFEVLAQKAEVGVAILAR